MSFHRALGVEVLRPDELGPAVAAILDDEARAGLARERRVRVRRTSVS